ncbi:MAG: MATE family efflux transporter [Lachnospiraceae bacterium]|jgi:putative efflux protein, MATE family|nr:MATE family efflux transporter [Lachnospiraceae bacterium]
MNKDLTTGSVFKSIIYFSLPYLLSYFLQTLYGMADLFIIGQFNGVESTTAVSIGSQVMHMLTVMIVGLAMGSTVIIGRAAGAKETKQANLAIGNTVIMFMFLSIICMALLLLAVKPFIYIMSTPEEAVPGTTSYLIICFIGIPFITAYNIISSIFRGMGDSKSPMYFIAVACIFNIVLDYIFIGISRLGTAGAALGTTLSQTISVIISLIVIKKRKMIPNICLTDFKPKKEMLGSILKIGIPVAAQDGFIQIAFIIITIFANQRGLNDAAAVGIVEKLIGILFLVPSSMLSAVSALSAQNIGAKKHDRAGQILKYATAITVLFGLIISAIMQFTAENAVSLFTGNNEVITLGGQYMRSYVWDCIFAGVHFCFSGYFCAYGLSIISFIHNSLSIICARIPLSYIASKYFTASLFPMGIAAPAGSLLSVIICIAAFIWLKKHPGKIKI